MPDEFLIRAALAGIGVALAAGPLGCFVVWRRMAYFGDATAHAAVLGVALSLLLSITTMAGVLIAALAMAAGVSFLSGRRIAMDTLLGVASHGALAVGLVAVALTGYIGLDLEAYLFGEILAVGRMDLVAIWTGALAVLGLLIWRWQPLLIATLGPDLAQAEDISPKRETLTLTLALAITVAVALKVVGALLITAMLIIPAAAARSVARTPEAMALIAALIGCASAVGGLVLSYQLDTPTGPTIVAVATGAFLIGSLLRSLARG
ncbi:MAG: metal ABC transporter permease [Pseudomonadota bacterium]